MSVKLWLRLIYCRERALYEQSRLKMEVTEKRQREKVKPKDTLEQLKEKAMLVLPQVVDVHKDTDQGRINVNELMRILDIPHNKAYKLRSELLVYLHADNDKKLNELRKRIN